MMIEKKDYERLKEYYDFQRKKEYNKEQLMYVCGHVAGEEPNKLFDLMWLEFEEKDYQEPPKHWIPKDPKYQLWYEDGKLDVKQLSPTARKVILRAKKDYERTNELGKKY